MKEISNLSLPDLIHHIASEASNVKTVEHALVDVCASYAEGLMRAETFDFTLKHLLQIELRKTYSTEYRRDVVVKYVVLLKTRVDEYRFKKNGGAA